MLDDTLVGTVARSSGLCVDCVLETAIVDTVSQVLHLQPVTVTFSLDSSITPQQLQGQGHVQRIAFEWSLNYMVYYTMLAIVSSACVKKIAKFLHQCARVM